MFRGPAADKSSPGFDDFYSVRNEFKFQRDNLSIVHDGSSGRVSSASSSSSSDGPGLETLDPLCLNLNRLQISKQHGIPEEKSHNHSNGTSSSSSGHHVEEMDISPPNYSVSSPPSPDVEEKGFLAKWFPETTLGFISPLQSLPSSPEGSSTEGYDDNAPLSPQDYCTYLKQPTNNNFEMVTFYIEGRTKNEVIYPGPEFFDVSVYNPSGAQHNVTIQPDTMIRTRYICTFFAGEAGVYMGIVLFGQQRQHIEGSPFKIPITRFYNTFRTPQPLFSLTKNSRGYAYGIDVDQTTNRIFVADQTASQIRIFSLEGHQISAFGHQDRFWRPTGLAVDHANNRLIISTPGRHRISIYTLDGQHIKSFGNLGRKNGEFDHPYGVAVSPNGNLIAVADAWNHRLQIFDKDGNFLWKYSVLDIDPFIYKQQFTAPRGVCFGKKGDAIYVSDSTLSTVLELSLDDDFNHAFTRTIVPTGRVNRPQGIIMDEAGNIVICDSNNNCLRVVSPTGYLISTISGIEKPQDAAFLRDGRIVIMDIDGIVYLY